MLHIGVIEGTLKVGDTMKMLIDEVSLGDSEGDETGKERMIRVCLHVCVCMCMCVCAFVCVCVYGQA